MSERSKSWRNGGSGGPGAVPVENVEATVGRRIGTPMDDDRTGSVHAHPLEVVSLAIGVILLTLGVVFAVGDVDVTRISLGWIWFGLLAAIGLVMLAFAWRRHRALAHDRLSSEPTVNP